MVIFRPKTSRKRPKIGSFSRAPKMAIFYPKNRIFGRVEAFLEKRPIFRPSEMLASRRPYIQGQNKPKWPKPGFPVKMAHFRADHTPNLPIGRDRQKRQIRQNRHFWPRRPQDLARFGLYCPILGSCSGQPKSAKIAKMAKIGHF